MSNVNDTIGRTNSTQAMSSLFSAYADDDPDDDIADRSTTVFDTTTVTAQENQVEDAMFSGSEDERDHALEDAEKGILNSLICFLL